MNTPTLGRVKQHMRMHPLPLLGSHEYAMRSAGGCRPIRDNAASESQRLAVKTATHGRQTGESEHT